MTREELLTRLTRLTDSLTLADRDSRPHLESYLAAFLYQNMNMSRTFRTALVGSDNITLSMIGRMSTNVRLMHFGMPDDLEEKLSELEGDFMREGAYLVDDAVPDMIPDDWA